MTNSLFGIFHVHIENYLYEVKLHGRRRFGTVNKFVKWLIWYGIYAYWIYFV